MKVYKSLIIVIGFMIPLLSGCQQQRTPQQWFDLTWSGLAGVDAVQIRGQAEVALLDASHRAQTFTYNAELDHHTQLTVKAVPDHEGREGGIKPAQKARVSDKETNNKLPDNTGGNPSAGGPAALTLQEGTNWVMLEDGTPSDAWTAAAAGRVNPLAAIEGLRLMKKNIRLEHGAARGTQVLRIEPDPEQELLRLKKDLTAELNRIQAEWSRQTASVKTQGKDGTTAVEEGDALIARSRVHLIKRLGKAKVNTVYHLTIDKQTNLPLRLNSETRISYTDDKGQAQTESLWNDAHFLNYR